MVWQASYTKFGVDLIIGVIVAGVSGLGEGVVFFSPYSRPIMRFIQLQLIDTK